MVEGFAIQEALPFAPIDWLPHGHPPHGLDPSSTPLPVALLSSPASLLIDHGSSPGGGSRAAALLRASRRSPPLFSHEALLLRAAEADTSVHAAARASLAPVETPPLHVDMSCRAH